ncbi:MAG: 50S ribosomal protein L25 [Anaerolineae bacterium]|nr:50S ribosomal protein L25 [Anaerolineae bacterium]
MAETIVLEATKRDVIGKQVKRLRAEGMIPGVLYGPQIESVPLQVEWVALRTALLQAGGSHIITLNVDGEPYNALVRRVHRSPMRGDVLHVDFYRVRMDVAIRTEVPVTLVGDIEAFEARGGAIMAEMTMVEIECLPGDLPAEIEVSVASLKEIGDMILASDLPELPGVTYLVDPEAIVATTSYLTRREEEEEVEAGEAEPELIRRREEDEEEDEA